MFFNKTGFVILDECFFQIVSNCLRLRNLFGSARSGSFSFALGSSFPSARSVHFAHYVPLRFHSVSVCFILHTLFNVFHSASLRFTLDTLFTLFHSVHIRFTLHTLFHCRCRHSVSLCALCHFVSMLFIVFRYV